MRLEDLRTICDDRNGTHKDADEFRLAAHKYLPELVRRLMRLRELLPINQMGINLALDVNVPELRELIHGELP